MLILPGHVSSVITKHLLVDDRGHGAYSPCPPSIAQEKKKIPLYCVLRSREHVRMAESRP